MKWADLLAMSINNLARRRLRTFLTVLGVVIGTSSIVIMVSLGLGLRKSSRNLVESSGSITTIQVSGALEAAAGSKEPRYLTDKLMEQFGRLQHVKSVCPFLDIDVVMRQGAYQATPTIRGVPRQYLEQIPLKRSTAAANKERELPLVFGNEIVNDFYNYKTGKGYYDTGKKPDVDLAGKPVFVIFDMDGYYEAQGGGNKKPPKKYALRSAGIVDGGQSGNTAHSYYVYTDLDMLKEKLRQVFRKKPIPGQPVNKKGKALPFIIYNSAEINVDAIENVEKVQKIVNDAGYQAFSNIDWLKQTEQQSVMIQAVLGGIGAVSLLVASIGIANTMMMSVYERTKEIGILKVLGCGMDTIGNMFLAESGLIGLIGGMAGIIFSYTGSWVINHVLKLGERMAGMTEDLSLIPLWLSLSSVAFSVAVGMLAGLFPALRAMRLSPLAAIRE